MVIGHTALMPKTVSRRFMRKKKGKVIEGFVHKLVGTINKGGTKE